MFTLQNYNTCNMFFKERGIHAVSISRWHEHVLIARIWQFQPTWRHSRIERFVRFVRIVRINSWPFGLLDIILMITSLMNSELDRKYEGGSIVLQLDVLRNTNLILSTIRTTWTKLHSIHGSKRIEGIGQVWIQPHSDWENTVIINSVLGTVNSRVLSHLEVFDHYKIKRLQSKLLNKFLKRETNKQSFAMFTKIHSNLPLNLQCLVFIAQRFKFSFLTSTQWDIREL